MRHISDLPEELRMRIAACMEHGSLPALHLVSRFWCQAANLAMRQLVLHSSPWPGQEPAEELRMSLIGQKWPNLERLELVPKQLASPDEHCRDLVLTLRPLTQLQDLYLALGALL